MEARGATKADIKSFFERGLPASVTQSGMVSGSYKWAARNLDSLLGDLVERGYIVKVT